MAESSKQKASLKHELQMALSSIRLSFDMWSSPNAYAVVSIYSHFIDKGGRRRTELLAFRRLFADHGGVTKLLRSSRLFVSMRLSLVSDTSCAITQRAMTLQLTLS